MATIATLNVLLSLNSAAFALGLKKSASELDKYGKILKGKGEAMGSGLSGALGRINLVGEVVELVGDVSSKVEEATRHTEGFNETFVAVAKNIPILDKLTNGLEDFLGTITGVKREIALMEKQTKEAIEAQEMLFKVLDRKREGKQDSGERMRDLRDRERSGWLDDRPKEIYDTNARFRKEVYETEKHYNEELKKLNEQRKTDTDKFQAEYNAQVKVGHMKEADAIHKRYLGIFRQYDEAQEEIEKRRKAERTALYNAQYAEANALNRKFDKEDADKRTEDFNKKYEPLRDEVMKLIGDLEQSIRRGEGIDAEEARRKVADYNYALQGLNQLGIKPEVFAYQTEQMEKLLKIALQVGEAEEKRKKALEDQKKVMDTLAGLQQDVDSVFDDSPVIGQLKALNATKEQIAQAEALIKKLDELKEAKKDADKAMADADAIRESTMTPLEKFQEEVDKIKELRDFWGTLDEKTAERALGDAEERLRKATDLDKATEPKRAPVEERRFTFTIPVDQKSADPLKGILKAETSTLKEAQKQSRLLQELADKAAKVVAI